MYEARATVKRTYPQVLACADRTPLGIWPIKIYVSMVFEAVGYSVDKLMIDLIYKRAGAYVLAVRLIRTFWKLSTFATNLTEKVALAASFTLEVGKVKPECYHRVFWGPLPCQLESRAPLKLYSSALFAVYIGMDEITSMSNARDLIHNVKQVIKGDNWLHPSFLVFLAQLSDFFGACPGVEVRWKCDENVAEVGRRAIYFKRGYTFQLPYNQNFRCP